MNHNCLIIEKMHPSIVDMLKAIGVEPDYKPEISKEEITEIIGQYEGIMVRSKIVLDKPLLQKATRLKYIARAGAGLDQIDVEATREKGIVILNAPEGNRDALAEHAVGMLLSLMNKMLIANRQIRNGIWNREGNRGFELKGKTVGLIGYGYMGQAFAQRLHSFQCEIIAYDKYKSNFSSPIVKEVTLEEIFEKSDILSFHIPLTPETKGWADLNFLNKFKKNIWLLNTARGEILKLKSLNQLLKSGKILGAALDVLENEKIDKLTGVDNEDFQELLEFENVLLTPHVGGWTFESYIKINEVLVEKIEDFLKS